MEKTVKKYRERYEQLPERFVRKIEYDLNYIQQKKLPRLCRIYLFGSAARGEVRSTSDIDLLVVTKNQVKNRELAAEIRWTLDEPIDGVRTDIVYRHEGSDGEAGKENTVFDREVKRDKTLILEVIE